jgi:membrane protein
MEIAREQRNQLDWLIQVAYTTGRLFHKNELHNHAAATALYFLLSATPLVLLVTYAAQALAKLAETSNFATILLAAFFSQFHLDELMAMGFIPSGAQAAVGGVSLVTLVLSSRRLVHAVQSAMRVIFPDDFKRRMIVSWAMPLVVIPAVFMLIILAVVAQGALEFLSQEAFLGEHRGQVLQTLNSALVLATVSSIVFLAYWRLPRPHPNAQLALLFAILCTLTLGLMYASFELFFSIERYHAVYGALGGVVFVLIGTYAAAMVFYGWAQGLFAVTKVDVAALEKLFLADASESENRIETWVFGRANRILDRYGKTYAPGEFLINEGDTTECAYFLYAGSVDLFKHTDGQDRKLGRLGAGELFGEMAYLLKEPRTASVVAATEVTALVLPPEMLEELMRYSAPLARRIIGTLCQRLQKMNQTSVYPLPSD